MSPRAHWGSLGLHQIFGAQMLDEAFNNSKELRKNKLSPQRKKHPGHALKTTNFQITSILFTIFT